MKKQFAITAESVKIVRQNQVVEEQDASGGFHLQNENAALDVWLQPDPFLDVYLDGHKIPHIKADVTAQSGESNLYTLHVGNIGTSIPVEDFTHTVWFIANAMAVAAGYSSFGQYSQEYNPYKKPKG